MEPTPLLKLHLRTLTFFLRIPAEHRVGVLETDFFAIAFDNAVWVVKEVVRVDECDANLRLISICKAVGVTVGMAVGDILQITVLSLLSLPSNFGSNLSDAAEVVKNFAQLIIPSLRWVELIETGELVKRWNGTSIVRRDARAWVPNQECEVELLQDLGWDDRWVSWLRLGVIWEWWLGSSIGVSVGAPVGRSVGAMAGAIDTVFSFGIGSNAALWDSAQGWGDGGVLGVGWGEVMGDVFDEETFALTLISVFHLKIRQGIRTASFSFSMLSKIVL